MQELHRKMKADDALGRLSAGRSLWTRGLKEARDLLPFHRSVGKRDPDPPPASAVLPAAGTYTTCNAESRFQKPSELPAAELVSGRRLVLS